VASMPMLPKEGRPLTVHLAFSTNFATHIGCSSSFQKSSLLSFLQTLFAVNPFTFQNQFPLFMRRVCPHFQTVAGTDGEPTEHRYKVEAAGGNRQQVATGSRWQQQVAAEGGGSRRQQVVACVVAWTFGDCLIDFKRGLCS